MKAIDKRDNALKKIKIDDVLKTQENNEDASNPKKKVVWQDNLNL